MPKLAEAPVQTRMLAPEPAESDAVDTQNLLYQPVPQLEGMPQFKIEYVWFTPEKAKELLRHSDSDPNFRQRITTLAQVRRHKNLMVTERFVHFLPVGQICLDEDGIMLNGKHRMTAVAGLEGMDIKAGFMVVKNVPRWMFKYFDTGKMRTIKDVFHIGARSTSPQTPSAMRLAMRYEEFLLGVRPAHGWRHWIQTKDEHNDVDLFLQRREELQDWSGVAEKINRNAKLLTPAGMVFYFYQNLAWPEGTDKLQEYCENLMTGGGAPQSPALVLREWAKDSFYNKDRIVSKRELHLLLLMRSFEQYVQNSRFPRLLWAYGNPMAMPYHPKGHDVAVQNVRFALEELNREAKR